MHKAGRERRALRIVVICACLLLALSVFAWGLHAKLSLYDAHVGPSAASAAKLLLTQKTGRDLVVMTTATTFAHLQLLLVALFAAVLALPLLRIRWLQPEISRRLGQDLTWHASVFSRPPPITAGAR